LLAHHKLSHLNEIFTYMDFTPIWLILFMSVNDIHSSQMAVGKHIAQYSHVDVALIDMALIMVTSRRF
jgi:hypothetical protein